MPFVGGAYVCRVYAEAMGPGTDSEIGRALVPVNASGSHSALGRRAHALEQFERCRSTLRSVHRLEPAAETMALLVRLAPALSLFDP